MFNSPHADRLRCARVLQELGDVREAEREVIEVLERAPEDLFALHLLAKIKHVLGEISTALALWVQVQSLVSGHEGAWMHLQAMLNLATDPERGAGEFVALGRSQLVRKPSAYLALEPAFRQFVARRPEDSRRICRELAERSRGGDRGLFRLAVIAEAWFAEQSGARDDACRILEALGRERGFEVDVDRLLGLAWLYEESGTRERLESALNIWHHLQREGVPVEGRLERLYRRLGDDARTEEHAQRHLLEFLDRMHRPSWEEILGVASTRYLPLRRLRELRPHRTGREVQGRRENAIARALDGDLTGALSGFAASTLLIDLKYAAETSALLGDRAEAGKRFALALRQDPADAHLAREALGWGPTGEVSEVLRDAELGSRVELALDASLQLSPRDPRWWRALALFYAVNGADARADRCVARSVAVEAALREREWPVGRVLSAAVYHFAGRAWGLLHEVWATRRAAEVRGGGGHLPRDAVLGNLTDDLRAGIDNTFLAVREYARARFPHLTVDVMDYVYGYKVTKEDEPSGGSSAGLPTALAFLGVFLQRPIPRDVAFTGTLVADAHDVLTIRPIGEVEFKVKAACHGNLRLLVVPRGNRPDLERSPRVPRAIVDQVVRYVDSFDDAVRIAFGDQVFVDLRRTAPPAPTRER